VSQAADLSSNLMALQPKALWCSVLAALVVLVGA
jgi:hypothetical protein